MNKMKYLVILADGASDEPIAELGNKTPLMAANTPHIDKLCTEGVSGLLDTVPPSLHPGSEVANMMVMGYDAAKYYRGRGVLEAASMGVKTSLTDLVFRCNLISLQDQKILNHSAGHISTDEANEIMLYLQDKLGADDVNFYPGVSYRHLMVLKGGNDKINCTPPHDVTGKPFKNVLPTALDDAAQDTVDRVTELMLKSIDLLKAHPVNLKRREAGKPAADMIWPWSQGNTPDMPTLKEMYGVESGVVISAVDLIYGLGAYAGLKGVHVEGSTGLYDTNYEGKAKAAIEALKDNQYVFLHIEASDEAGHEGDYMLKTKTIEYLDQRVVKYVTEEIAKMDEPVSIALLPDHPTPCALKTHTRDAVPFFIKKPGQKPDAVTQYNEESAKAGGYGMLYGPEFMQELLK
ncbi:2,3-bisphosphoglycerate-independent phosphoglycerate mutase [Saccharicrinis carchari]|uniref:2,3-bisphosphoglycerate-independent phosphoglycerate mutase n=1 Tax=Saccharicrinis carchari TaxID=1168039 RepID=A0A521AUJ9_SACCC|nr:cofactor-independent phosphoglycerate mutase [Saccharicrinis carchari]SMO38513.1 2,3-bisphosphoglycerate-independent phosphoglycerate mutase [Saccharicrinis carchari]